jgi:hypothetical protein
MLQRWLRALGLFSGFTFSLSGRPTFNYSAIRVGRFARHRLTGARSLSERMGAAEPWAALCCSNPT